MATKISKCTFSFWSDRYPLHPYAFVVTAHQLDMYGSQSSCGWFDSEQQHSNSGKSPTKNRSKIEPFRLRGGTLVASLGEYMAVVLDFKFSASGFRVSRLNPGRIFPFTGPFRNTPSTLYRTPGEAVMRLMLSLAAVPNVITVAIDEERKKQGPGFILFSLAVVPKKCFLRISTSM